MIPKGRHVGEKCHLGAWGCDLCCGKNVKPSKCTPIQLTAQYWLEPPVTTNPYSRIQSQLTAPQAPSGYCLTRIGNC